MITFHRRDSLNINECNKLLTHVKYLPSLIENAIILGLGCGIPYVLGTRWTRWIKDTWDPFRFLQGYLITLQVILSMLYLVARPTYLTPSKPVYIYALESPIQHWPYFLYLFLSLTVIFLYITKLGRSKAGAILSFIIIFINWPLAMLGVDGILTRMGFDKLSDNFAFFLFTFRLILGICIWLPALAWVSVFSSHSWTSYKKDEIIETDINEKDPVYGWLTKLVIESFSEIDSNSDANGNNGDNDDGA